MRNEHGQFVAGASGNPGGRPRVVREVRDMIEAIAPELIAELVEIARDRQQPGRVRIAAVTALFDRRYGRPRRELAWSSGLEVSGRLAMEPLEEPQEALPAEPAGDDALAAGAAPEGESGAEPVEAGAEAGPEPPTASDEAPKAVSDQELKEPGRPDEEKAPRYAEPAPSHVAGGGPWRFGMDWPLRPRGRPPLGAAPPHTCSEVQPPALDAPGGGKPRGEVGDHKPGGPLRAAVKQP